MNFASPERLLLLLVLPLVVLAYQASGRRRNRRAAGLAAQGLVATGTGQHRDQPQHQNWRRHLPFALFLAALALLAVGVARPMARIKTPRRQATVVLDFDVSNSMGAKDVKPSRIKAAEAVARDFVNRQPSGVKIGVVAFGQGAVVVQPPTFRRPAVLQAIDHLSLGGGTSLGEGIQAALEAISGKKIHVNQAALGQDTSGEIKVGYFGGSTIVLFSDGQDTSHTNPLTWARVASLAGVRIQAVGIGTAGGTDIKVDGFTMGTALDSKELQALASVTNGSYHHLGGDLASGPGLQAISRTINLHFSMVTQYTEVTALFVAAAALLMVVGASVSLFWFGRIL